MKTCSKCKLQLDFTFFRKNKTNKDGYQYQCKTCHSESCKKYYENNKEKVYAATEKWKKNNAARIKEQAVKTRKRNKANRTALQMKRHASKLQATPSWLTKEDLQEIQYHYNIAAYFTWLSGGFVKHHVDHIVPLQGKEVRGLHVPWNLQVMIAEDNIRKGNKLHVE